MDPASSNFSETYYIIWLALCLVSVCLLTYGLLQRYAGSTPDLSPLVKGLTFTGWFLGLATIAVLPLDISLAQQSKQDLAG